jgi:hypothetical protein
MPNPQKWPSRPGQITTRGIIRLLRGRGSHKIVLAGSHEGKMGFEKREQRGSSKSQTKRKTVARCLDRGAGLGLLAS